jgi:hypothetical protein
VIAWKAAAVAALCAASWPLAAQQRPGRFELGLALGRSFGGTLARGSNAYFDREVDSDTAISKGIRLGYAFDPRWSAELLAERVDTRFVESAGGVFASQPQLGILQLRFIEAGARYAFLTGRLVPFAGAGLGIAVLDPDIPDRRDVRDTERFAAHLVAGFKAYARPWIGLRVDVRPRFVSLSAGHWFTHVDLDAGLFVTF